MEFYDLVNFSTYLSPVFLVLGIGIGIYFFKSIDIFHKIIVIYLGSMLAIDLLARLFGEVYGNNLIFIPILGFIELSVFSVFYYFSGLNENRATKFLLFGIIALSFLFSAWEIYKVYDVPIEEFESYSKAISTCVVVLLSIGYFIDNIRKRKNISEGEFLLNSGILMYFSLELILFLPIDFLINDGSGLKYYFWFANLIFTLVFYNFLIISVWKNGRIQG